MNADLLVVLGGPIGVMDGEAYPWLKDEINGLCVRLAAQRPTLGICLGAQLMAAALGASAYPGKAKEIGWSAVSLAFASPNGSSAAQTLGALEGVPVLHWHGDTFDLPQGSNVQLLASTALTPHQAFSAGNYGLALQFHPEADYKLIEEWLIGHAVELELAKVALSKLRSDGAVFGQAALKVGQSLLRHWLEQTGLAISNGLQSAQPYQPVNCEFHDVLESVSTLGKPVHIEVQSPLGGTQQYFAAIADVFSRRGAEYIALHSGELIRLDWLIAVDSVSAKQFG